MIQAQPFGNTTDVVDDSSPWITKKQPRKCRDPVFAVLLYANVAAIVGVFIKYGQNLAVDTTAAATDDNLEDNDYTAFVYTAAALAGFSAIFSATLMQVLMCVPGFLIKAAIFFTIGLAAVIAAVSLSNHLLYSLFIATQTPHIASYCVFQ